MIEFHNHVIPKIDDGSKNIEMSIDMIRKAHVEGTTCIINTVHYQHPRIEDKSLDEINLQKSLLEKELEKEKIPISIISSAEVYFSDNLHEIIENPITTIAKKYMLIEFPTNLSPNGMKDVFFELQVRNIYPIIAHPERYSFVEKNPDIVKKWINKDYMIQINSGSIVGDFGSRMQKLAFSLIRDNSCHLIGSDAHNNKDRNFCLKKSLEIVQKKFGDRNIEIINNNLNSLINGNDLKRIQSKPKKKYWFF
tara:strand:- start:4174 stop:4926 length:753 start_codon:yes stop_codon:yes gene_type:complete